MWSREEISTGRAHEARFEGPLGLDSQVPEEGADGGTGSNLTYQHCWREEAVGDPVRRWKTGESGDMKWGQVFTVSVSGSFRPARARAFALTWGLARRLEERRVR